MKKKIIIGSIFTVISIMVLTLSYQDTTEHRNVYYDTVLKFVTEDIDLLDYNIDPQLMAECVVDTSEMKMKGTRLDILRSKQYDLYETWIRIKLGEKVFTEKEDIQRFGVQIAGNGAHTNFGVSYQYCVDKVPPHNQQKILEDDDWARKVAINVRLWWEDIVK